MSKVFIAVTAEHDAGGKIHPLALTWTDGRKYEIDRVLDVRQAASLKCGGQGLRYTCRICGKEVYLFCDEGKWFVDC
ncbi:MAG: hypothetical protein H6Q66_1138 [Firmicutes bacterium]|nr:hypothetical protein [Bacillota bacterium]